MLKPSNRRKRRKRNQRRKNLLWGFIKGVHNYMTTFIKELGDSTSRDVKPDFESAKGYYWMKQMYEARKAEACGEPVHLPRKPRSTPAEYSYFEQVDRRLSRQSFIMGASFDKQGKLIKE
jgi:hypothetical protein